MITAFLILAAVSVCAQTLSWAPSGDRLVHDIDGQLVIVDAYSLGETVLGPGQNPKWSPVGDLILFQHKERVFVQAAAKNSPARPVGEGKAVGWSPDGDRLARWQSEIREGEIVPVIYLHTVDGRNTQEIVLTYLDYDVPAWWSIGILYLAVEGWGIRTAEHRYAGVVDPETGRHRNTSNCEPETVSWSPATGRLAYFYEQPDYHLDDGFVPDRGLYVQESFGVKRREIGDNLSGGYAPSWSPDGQSLAFSLFFERRVAEIFQAQGPDLQDIRQLTSDGQTSFRPNWSPAGDQIAYFSSSDESNYSVKFLRTSQDLPTAAVRSLTWGQVKNQDLPCPDADKTRRPHLLLGRVGPSSFSALSSGSRSGSGSSCSSLPATRVR